MEQNTRRVGTVSRGIRCPIIREGDDLAAIVTESVLEAAEYEGFSLHNRDVISITESIAARAQGNYASVDAIAKDVKEKLGGGTVGVIFPILSRNRFAICLRGIASGAKKIVLMLSYPSDEVGNSLVSLDKVDEAGVNPYSDVLTLKNTASFSAKTATSSPELTMLNITAILSANAVQRLKSSLQTTRKQYLTTPTPSLPAIFTPVPAPSVFLKTPVQKPFSDLTIFSPPPLTAAATTKNTVFSVPTNQPKIRSSFSRATASPWFLRCSAESLKRPANMLRL